MLRIKWNFELTMFELTVPDLYCKHILFYISLNLLHIVIVQKLLLVTIINDSNKLNRNSLCYSRFSRTHKIGNIGIIANIYSHIFVFSFFICTI